MGGVKLCPVGLSETVAVGDDEVRSEIEDARRKNMVVGVDINVQAARPSQSWACRKLK